MANTSDIYSGIIIENIVKKYLEQGQVPTLEQIEAEFDAISATQDLTSSDFTSTEWKVERKEESSATKYNGGNEEIHQDLVVLYKSLYDNSQRSVELFSRWQTKATSLENRIRSLESRIGRLLSLAQDTSGYFETVGDKFTDTALVDLDESSGLFFNLKTNTLYLDKVNSTKSTKPDRIFLNELRTNQVVFTVLSKSNILAVNNQDNTEPRFAFSDQNKFWKTNIVTNAKVSPVITELLLTLDETITISQLDIFLHSSQSNTLTRATPLYSVDGINYSRFASINTIGTGLDKISFQFPQTEVLFLKIILEKDDFDFIDNQLYTYEFGAREIALYNQSFTAGTDAQGILYTKSLSVTNPDETKVQFNKVTLDACEAISSETKINYYIAVAKEQDDEPLWLTSSGFSTNSAQRLWYPISPVKREAINYPTVLDFATISSNTVEDIGISFDDAGTLISPAASFNLLSNSGSVVSQTGQTASEQRYIFSNSYQRSLDLQIDVNASVDIDHLTLWRNVGEKGIGLTDTSRLVRGIQAGWEYSQPYYLTNILIESSTGISIDVGNNPIIIDNKFYTGVIGPDILSPGIHSVKVHQNFWGRIEPDLNSITELKAADVLYPYNQKLLIEGYSYGSSYPDYEEHIYQGVDRFAGFVLDKISIFDMLNNTNTVDYSKFALDTDIPETSDTSDLSYIFVLNVDISQADYINEKFVLDFNLTDQLFSYLAMKAEFTTNNSQLTPILDEYTIKLGL